MAQNRPPLSMAFPALLIAVVVFFCLTFFAPLPGLCVKVTSGEEGKPKQVPLKKGETVLMTPESATSNGGDGVTPSPASPKANVQAQGEQPMGPNGETPPMDPKTAEIEERVTRYKFILESLGFTLQEFIISPDEPHQIQLTFEGRLNTTQNKLDELSEKFPDEEKLLGMLTRLYDYNRRDLTNYAPYKVILRLSQPLYIAVHYRKF